MRNANAAVEGSSFEVDTPCSCALMRRVASRVRFDRMGAPGRRRGDRIGKRISQASDATSRIIEAGPVHAQPQDVRRTTAGDWRMPTHVRRELEA
ncbi:hypothetical protein AQ477_29405 [Burkholderia thailandensis]|nr:hypothetical protein AQ477_29405 [Burkholderia thailandensis]KXF57528.1 hypothetical protein AQ476_22300 [Burkholderia thailandensis]PNE77739.1 hypothetical protein A8H37_05470 [Burkholderia thailandensis]